LTAKGVLKITDFSLAIECPAVESAVSESLVGSPAFWAPEIWRESTYSYQSDLYAAGIVLYEMLNGNFPWKVQDKTAEQLQKAKNSKLVLPLLLSKEAKSLLKNLLNPNLSFRSTIEDVKTDPWMQV
jgi:serine/threonine protein kinase